MQSRMLAGRYRLNTLLGRGGMAVVWRAVDEQLDREVAVKAMDLSGPDSERAAERFRKEARTTARLNHPNIVTVFDSGVDGQTAYIVMELLSGPTLAAELLEHGPMQFDEVRRIGQQVCAGLAAAHDAGIIHRDIKPGNIAYTAAGMVKVLDFGITQLVDEAMGLTSPTGPQTVLGTAEYLSPEQASAMPIDERADLYAFGCVLAVLLTGKPPFLGKSSALVLMQHIQAPLPDFAALRPGMPQGFVDLLRDLLAKDRFERPRTAREVQRRLAAMSLFPPGEELPRLRARVPPGMLVEETGVSGAMAAMRPVTSQGPGPRVGQESLEQEPGPEGPARADRTAEGGAEGATFGRSLRASPSARGSPAAGEGSTVGEDTAADEDSAAGEDSPAGDDHAAGETEPGQEQPGIPGLGADAAGVPMEAADGPAPASALAEQDRDATTSDDVPVGPGADSLADAGEATVGDEEGDPVPRSGQGAKWDPDETVALLRAAASRHLAAVHKRAFGRRRRWSRESPSRLARRRRALVLFTLAGAAALLLVVLWLAGPDGVLGTLGAPRQTATATAYGSPAPSVTGRQEALALMRLAVTQAMQAGEIDARAALVLNRRLDAIALAIQPTGQTPGGNAASQQVDALAVSINTLAVQRHVTDAGRQRLAGPFADLQRVIPPPSR